MENKIIKALSICLVILILSFGTLRSQWEVVYANGVDSNDVGTVFFHRGDTLATGWKNLYYSFDGGKNWVKKNLPISSGETVTSVVIVGDSIYVGVRNYGIFLSTDLGESWIERNNGLIMDDQGELNWRFYRIDYFDDVMFTSTLRHCYSSTDRGENWVVLDTLLNGGPTPAIITLGVLKMGNEIWVNGYTRLYHSIDNGKSWAKKGENYGGIRYSSLLLRDEGLLIGTSEYGILYYRNEEEGYKIRNKWLPYKTITINSFATYEEYIFAASSGGLGPSYAGLFLSTDGGWSWNRVIFDSTNVVKQALDVFIIRDTIMIPDISNRILKFHRAPIKEVISKVKQSVGIGNEEGELQEEIFFDKKTRINKVQDNFVGNGGGK